MGSDYLIPTPGKGGTVYYKEDKKRLEELTALFARKIKPSELYQLTVLINAMCNLGDFELYSIDVKRPKHNAGSDRGKQRGLNSPHGRRVQFVRTSGGLTIIL